MTSGIYKLTFNHGYYYIGKSKDIQRRWKEHFTKFEKGTAARNMQEAFNQAGYPSTEIIYEVHPEHLDVLEPIAIHNHWGPKILNTTRESCCEDLLERHIPYCKYSLATIFQNLEAKVNEIDKLKKEIEKAGETLKAKTEEHKRLIKLIKSGTQLEKCEKALVEAKELCKVQDWQIQELKNRGLIARILNK